MPTIEKYFEIRCKKCDRDLERETSVEGSDINTVLEVEPCEDCLKSEYDSGYEEGYETGYDEGYNKGYEDACKEMKIDSEASQ